ncbi:MAG: hypothetical protein U1E76_05610 [Planctomycetota bacterium]
MLSRTLCALSISALLTMPPTASQAGDCSGDPGYVLTVPATVELGEIFTIQVQAPAQSDVFLLVSSGQGPTVTPFGTFCLNFPPLIIFHFRVPGDGKLTFGHEMDCDRSLIGAVGYLQFLAIDMSTLVHGLSNQASITVKDGPCDDKFCSYTQGGWGAGCAGHNVGCLRDAHFADVFPNGLLLGDQDGVDGDGLFALVLRSAAAVENFLPQGSQPGTLDQDLLDPTTSSAGVFGGQLTAAKLNVAFDDAGLFDPTKNGNPIHLGDLVYADCVDRDLIDLTVRDVIAIADRVIAGEFGICTSQFIAPSGCQSVDIYDVDGDGIPDVSIENLSDALDILNNAFDECVTGRSICFHLP